MTTLTMAPAMAELGRHSEKAMEQSGDHLATALIAAREEQQRGTSNNPRFSVNPAA